MGYDTGRKRGRSKGISLNINATNTKLMYMCTKLGDGDGQSIEGKQIEEVNEFTYLKSPASKKGGYDEDIQHQQS